MTKEQISEKIKEVVCRELKVSKAKLAILGRNGKFVDLGADSLDHAELIMAIEDEFGVSMPPSEAEKIHCLDDLVNFVEEQTKA